MEMERKYFSDGKGNFDDAPFAVEINDFINKENCRTGSTDAGVTGTVESIGSTLLLSTPEPSITFIELGAVEDAENDRILYFKKNVHGPWDRIECWDIANQTTYIVLYSAQVVGGLNFDKYYPIHSARVVDGLLYWTDNLNRQRKVNIDAGINLNHPGTFPDTEAYTDPLNEEVISLLKRPPLLPLQISKVWQTVPALTNNFIKDGAFQFCARYYYKDGETSVLSTYSELANYNISSDNYNRIDVVFQLEEKIDQDVQRVDLVVRYGETLQFFVANFWDKNNPTDAAEIQAHNDGVTLLSYSFLNDKIGEALDGAYVVKPFESIPIISETLDVARNRLYLANNVIGYDTPVFTSLEAAFVTNSEGATVIGTWVSITYNFGLNVHYFLDIQDVGTDNGFYDTTLISQPPPFPISVAIGDLTKVAGGPADFAIYVVANYPDWTGGIVDTGNTSEITGISPVSLTGATSFKTDASYQIGIKFGDFGDRKCGVLTSDFQIYKTPDREFTQITFITGLNWVLINSNAINEIPDYATTYSIVITKCLRTRYFLESRVKNITYATKVVADGTYVFNTSAYAATLNGVAIDITLLNSYGMGYVFTEGDLVKVYIDGDATVYTLSIVAQDGICLIDFPII